MKRNIFLLVVSALLLALNLQLATSQAQGTAFAYQGRLSSGGSAANGTFDFRFKLYADPASITQIGSTYLTNAIGATNGLFLTLLDFGSGIFTGSNYWLEIAVRTNGGGSYATLSPLQSMTPVPYAVFANTASNLTGSVAIGQLPATLVTNNASGLNLTGSFSGTGAGLTNLNASNLGSGLVPDARLAENLARTNQVWLLNGNSGTTPAVNFIGTTDNQILLFQVNHQTVQRFEPTTLTPNIIGGYAGNFDSGIYDFGVTISGGGQIGLPNTVQGTNVTFATIAGGTANTINGTNVYHSVISGGAYNFIVGDNAYQSVVAGGVFNTNQTWGSAIGGGAGNNIQPGADHSVIAGGYFNNVQTNAGVSFIGAGDYNTIQLNAGGSVIGGGNNSTIQTNADHSVIAGGWQNLIENWAYESVISGGELNDIGQFAVWSVIAGGEFNTNQSAYSSILGGKQNLIYPNSIYTVIGGGLGNQAYGDLYNYGTLVIAGGYANIINSNSYNSSIGGGQENSIGTNSDHSTIGGGWGNSIQGLSQEATISGGADNAIRLGSTFSDIGGGYGNIIQSNTYAAVINGGSSNIITPVANYSLISGGWNNRASGLISTVLGGYGNWAAGNYSLVAGIFAQATNSGSFVLSDNHLTNFYSTADNQFSARFLGGVRFVTGGAGMTIDGLPIMSGNNGGGLTNVNAALLNGVPASALAPASGSANYIQNQSAAPQAASFNISGTAAVSGTVTANALVVSNNFRVPGAGIGTSTPAFIQRATAANIEAGNPHRTTISNPLCDGDANALLIITHNYNPGNTGNILDAHASGVYYNPTLAKWQIFHEDLTALTVNDAWNVLVFKP